MTGFTDSSCAARCAKRVMSAAFIAAGTWATMVRIVSRSSWPQKTSIVLEQYAMD